MKISEGMPEHEGLLELGNIETKKQISKRFNNICLYLATISATLIILFCVCYPIFDISVPLGYSGDVLLVNAIIKSILDTGLYIDNPYLASPSVFTLAEFPFFTPFNYIIVELLSLFTQSNSSVLNIYYFLTFPLTTTISLIIFRRLGLNTFFAIIASLLFSFIPYHLFRGVLHLFVNTYFVVPIFSFLAIYVYRNNDFFLKKAESVDEHFRNIGLCLLPIFGASCSSAGYFAFFGCYILLIAGVLSSLEKKLWQPIFNAFFFVFLTAMTFALTLSPTAIKHFEQGKNDQVFARGPNETEYYSLKITQLLFPSDNHRVTFLKKFKTNYNQTAPLVNENRTASLGIVGTLGFLATIFILVLKRGRENETLFITSILNISCVLFAVTGGLSSIFSYLVSPILHAPNRISVFISFFSLLTFFILLQLVLKEKLFNHKKIVVRSIAIIILVIGLYDEIPEDLYSKQGALNIKSLVDQDLKFTQKIESMIPPYSAILQLPYMPFPESPRLYNMGDYEQFKPYLNSKKLRWSYGFLRGSPFDIWRQAMNKKPLTKELKEIAHLNFVGLCIHRNGYPDHGLSLEKELFKLTKIKPVIHENQDMAFYDLRPYFKKLKEKELASWDKEAQHLRWKFSLSANWCNGFWGLEHYEKETSRWCNKKGCLKINNCSKENIPVSIKFRLYPGNPQATNITISGDLFAYNGKIDPLGQEISKHLILKPGTHHLNFKTTGKKVNTLNDPRTMYFRIANFVMEPDVNIVH